MTYSWNPFSEPDDTGRLIDLMRRMVRWNEGGVGWLHPGDVVWMLYPNLTVKPEKSVRIVSDGSGTSLALVEMTPPSTFLVHFPGDVDDPEAVLRFAIRQAEAELQTQFDVTDDAPGAYDTEALSVQPWAGPILRDMGYAPANEADFRVNGQPLDRDLPAPELRNGATVRAVRDEPDDLKARVALHCEVWESAKFSLEGYERLRTKPLYRPDLDLVVETADGELAAYCIVWWDPVTKTGEFEPVGTSERFRRQGFGKAVVLEGLRRLKDLGAEYAMVICSLGPTYEPSRFLYTSAGFEPVFRYEVWKKPG